MRKARTRRRWTSSMLVAAALGLLLTACSEAPQSVLNPAGPFAEKPDDLFQVVFWLAVVVFVIVQGLILYTAWRFRERKDDDASLPVQVHGNTKLEIFWTLVPAMILAGLAVPTVQMIFELDAEPDDAITVEVIGHRWWWEYRYPGHDIVTANELTIPAGVPVRLEMTSQESGSADRGVIHSFWIPRLAGKQDVVPGRITTLNLEADEPGTYLGACAEYCGLSHANMRARAVALPMDEWEQWLQDQQQPAAQPEPGTLAAEGAELFGALENSPRSCVACHSISGRTDGGAAVGPDLTHLMSRAEFAGSVFDLNEDNLEEWLRDPPAMKPMRPEDGIGMPDLNLTEDEIEALVAYLLTLE